MCCTAIGSYRNAVVKCKLVEKSICRGKMNCDWTVLIRRVKAMIGVQSEPVMGLCWPPRYLGRRKLTLDRCRCGERVGGGIRYLTL